MTKDLERDLGLPAVLAISIGAMIGSGIFILPALAINIAGPGVILAYLIAGLLVVPAALSKSEMATAMPEAGGTYIYIERGMGPLLGTIAGVGTWFSLAFKGALALVGGVPYLVLLFDLPVKPVALVLAVVLIAVNLLGVKQTGRLQVAIVVVMLAALLWFIYGGMPATETANYDGFFADGAGGLLAATGLVFVSYAGVTKVASVAEEVERPDRNIPLGILGSLAFTTVLYVLIVAVMVGVSPLEELADTETPMAIAAEATLAQAGVVAVVLAAILALVSTANAGILSSSRYPFAMSRDNLAPDRFAAVSDRFGTPTTAITLTGSVMLVLIAFVPILEIAKLASAFQILVFILINVAIIAFRNADMDEYDPSFESPLYPAIQVFGILSGVVLLTQMGGVALVGAVIITVGSVAWYWFYARSRIDREGVAVDTIRRKTGREAVDRTEASLESQAYDVLVALTEGTTEEREQRLVHIAADMARQHDGGVTVIQFDEVPDQVPLQYASETQSSADLQFEAQTDHLSEEFDVPIQYGEIVSHDTKHAIVNFAEHEGANAILMERHPGRLSHQFIGSPIEWILRHAPCDVLLVEDRAFDDVSEITVLTDQSPYDPSKVRIADALAGELGATVRLVYAIDESATTDFKRTLDDYHSELVDLCSAPVTTEIVETDGSVDDLITIAASTEFLVLSRNYRLSHELRDSVSDQVIDAVEIPVLGVHTHESKRPGPLGRLVERYVF
ncbi:universal stress protein [Haloterrigena alkaliphila]|uniref:Amino acid permease n=1 Tax=Haloterrigena alkaliphila TaxID=2816475 RepID=A0A8A2V975_9EURY|nr:universal stress protein [Haloterrigena alkaliphila]QSW98483.1 universal stress protein [Haloterrigena alkaliphila]